MAPAGSSCTQPKRAGPGSPTGADHKPFSASWRLFAAGGSAVLVVSTAIAEGATDGCERYRQRTDDPPRWRRCLHLAPVGSRQNHHVQRVRQAVLADSPVAREPEERLEEGLRVERRPKLDQRRCL